MSDSASSMRRGPAALRAGCGLVADVLQRRRRPGPRHSRARHRPQPQRRVAGHVDAGAGAHHRGRPQLHLQRLQRPVHPAGAEDAARRPARAGAGQPHRQGRHPDRRPAVDQPALPRHGRAAGGAGRRRVPRRRRRRQLRLQLAGADEPRAGHALVPPAFARPGRAADPQRHVGHAGDRRSDPAALPGLPRPGRTPPAAEGHRAARRRPGRAPTPRPSTACSAARCACARARCRCGTWATWAPTPTSTLRWMARSCGRSTATATC